MPLLIKQYVNMLKPNIFRHLKLKEMRMMRPRESPPMEMMRRSISISTSSGETSLLTRLSSWLPTWSRLLKFWRTWLKTPGAGKYFVVMIRPNWRTWNWYSSIHWYICLLQTLILTGWRLEIWSRRLESQSSRTDGTSSSLLVLQDLWRISH